MKCAKEMFEQLGYKLIDKKDKLIYENDYTEQKITIYKNDKKIIFELIWLNDNDYYVFTSKELQAINKQVEELGWLDE